MPRILSILILLTFLTSCNGATVDRSDEVYNPQVGDDRHVSEMKSLITKSDEPIIIYGGKKKKSSSSSSSDDGISHSYLWKASLESISFMPLIAVDSNGGAILTDWYSSPQTPNEKFKFNIIITSVDLQISSIKVTAFRQVKNIAGSWHSAEVSRELSQNIEDNILRKAISLKNKAEDN